MLRKSFVAFVALTLLVVDPALAQKSSELEPPASLETSRAPSRVFGERIGTMTLAHSAVFLATMTAVAPLLTRREDGGGLVALVLGWPAAIHTSPALVVWSGADGSTHGSYWWSLLGCFLGSALSSFFSVAIRPFDDDRANFAYAMSVQWFGQGIGAILGEELSRRAH